jgi:hypothetical protein
MQVLGFSPRVRAEVGRFLAEHPVIEIKVLRAADMGSRPAALDGGTCQECGWEWKAGKLFTETLSIGMEQIGEELPAGTLPADFMDSIAVTHAWDQASRSHYCGGRLSLC